jgi:hypothetical protein
MQTSDRYQQGQLSNVHLFLVVRQVVCSFITQMSISQAHFGNGIAAACLSTSIQQFVCGLTEMHPS